MTIQADHEREHRHTQAEVRQGLAASAEALQRATEEYERWLLASPEVGLTTRTVGSIVGRDSTSISERIRRLRRQKQAQPKNCMSVRN